MGRSEAKKTQIAFLERLAVWQAAIDYGVFTLRDIHNETSLSHDHLSNRIYEMYNAGVVGISYAPGDRFSTQSMLAVYSVKLRNSRPNSIPRWRRNAWRSIRIYKRFTVGKIMDTLPGADVSSRAVGQMCETLCDFDILRRDGYSTSGEAPVYALVRDYGGIPNCNNSLSAKPSSLLPAASNLSSASISSKTAASLLNSAASIGRAAKWEQRYLAKVKHLLPGYSPARLAMELIYDALSRSICYNLNGVIYILHSPDGVSIHGRRKAIDLA